MSATNVNFHLGVSTSDQITIFVPPGAFDAHVLGATYKANLFITEQFLIIRINSPEVEHIAVQLSLKDEIASGKKVVIAHLHPVYQYVLEQAVLDFTE